MIDLRSDTVTRPTPSMLAAMMQAEVGDDVFGEDPTVNALEAYAADLFKMEAALFCASGTQTNQIAIKCHTQPGEEVICSSNAHVYIYEGGGIAFNSGCQVRALDNDRGKITVDQVQESIIDDSDVHKAPTTLVCLEQTANRGGGACYDVDTIVAIKEICKKHGLHYHLDGARLFNAIIAGHGTPEFYGEQFDSISICLSKGLGAPVGSLLLGNKEFIKKARRVRKVMGGGMRQAGYLAAAGLFALKNHVERLAEDHQHAHTIAEHLLRKNFVGKMLPVETNIIIFEVLPPYSPSQFVQHLHQHGILCMHISTHQVRIVTHLDVKPEDVQLICKVIDNI